MTDYKAICAARNIKVVPKKDSKLMAIISFFAHFVGITDFRTHVWTTIGSTIYYPTVVDPWALYSQSTLVHEMQHVKDFRAHPIWFPVSYVLGFPLPFGFAYFRAYWEVRAYALNVYRKERTIDKCAESISSSLYLWPWRKKWVVKMLKKEVERLKNND